jgi:hypothetical protein
LGFDKGHVDGVDELSGGKVENLVARAIIAVSNKHATKIFRGEFIYVAVFQTEVGRASEDLVVR